MKPAWVIFLLVALLGFLVCGSFNLWQPLLSGWLLSPSTLSGAVGNFNLLPLENKATLIFVGDMMFDRSVKASLLKNYAGDYTAFLSGVSDVAEADLTFGNLEGPVSNRGTRVGSIYSFRFDPAVLPALKVAGFDVLSMANNHIGDYAYEALMDTPKLMKENGLVPVGGGENYSDAMLPRITEVNHLKICWFGASEFRPRWQTPTKERAGINDVTDPNFYKFISAYRSACDFIIASIHFGTEYQTVHNAFQEKYAKRAIDSGTNLVVGHHPHVAEEVIPYKNGLIAYSLGNFIFDQYFSPETMSGLVLKVEIGKNKIISYSTSTSYQDKTYKTTVEIK